MIIIIIIIIIYTKNNERTVHYSINYKLRKEIKWYKGGRRRGNFIEMIYENLFDDSMNSSVALMIALFDSIGNLSSPYKIIETNSS